MFSLSNLSHCLWAFILLSCTIAPVKAELANFNSLTIAPAAPQDQASGMAGGNYSFLSLSNSDRAGNDCLGFGSSNPDHFLKIKDQGGTVNLAIQNNGEAYAMVVKTPQNEFICVSGEELAIDTALPGEYQVWVGSDTMNKTFNYRLVAEIL